MKRTEVRVSRLEFEVLVEWSRFLVGVVERRRGKQVTQVPHEQVNS